MIRYLYLIIFTFCSSMIFGQNFDNLYKNWLNEFDKKYLNHFPKEINGNLKILETISPNSNQSFCFEYYYLFLGIEYTDEEYKKIKKYIDRNLKERITYKDSSFILLFRFCEEKHIGGLKINKQENKLAKLNLSRTGVPIPYFNNIYSDSLQFFPLKRNFIISVLDSKPGLFLDRKLLHESPYLPEEWRHGYSKGIATNDKQRICIFWYCIW